MKYLVCCPQSNYSKLAEYLCNNKTILEKIIYNNI